MCWRQLIHQKLKQASILDRGWSQQILNQFKHRNNVAFLRFAVFRNQQNHRCQQPFRCIIKKCILSIAAGRRTIRTDDGFCGNLCVLFRFCFCYKITVIFQVFIHVLVDQSKNVIPVRAGRISQIQNRDFISVMLFRNSGIVSEQIAFRICGQKTHAGCTGILNIGVQKISGLTDTGRTDHQAVDVSAVHQCCNRSAFLFVSDHQALFCRKRFSFPPLLRLIGDMGIRFPDFFFCCKPCGSVLSVSNRP